MLRCWYSEVSCASRHAASDRRDLRVTSYYTHTNINIYIPSHIRNAHAQFRASLLRIYALPCSCGVCFADNSLSVQNVSMPTTCIRRRQSGFKKKNVSFFISWLAVLGFLVLFLPFINSFYCRKWSVRRQNHVWSWQNLCPDRFFIIKLFQYSENELSIKDFWEYAN